MTCPTCNDTGKFLGGVDRHVEFDCPRCADQKYEPMDFGWQMLKNQPPAAEKMPDDEPFAWAREWEGDDSDLGNYIIEIDNGDGKPDDDPHWFPLFTRSDLAPSERVKELEAKVRHYANLLDKQLGTPCAEIRWQQEREELQAKVKELEAEIGCLQSPVDYPDYPNEAYWELAEQATRYRRALEFYGDPRNYMTKFPRTDKHKTVVEIDLGDTARSALSEESSSALKNSQTQTQEGER